MKKILLLPFLFLCLQAFPQMDMASQYASIIDTSLLQQHLSIIASAGMEGRETGTEGQRKAAEYIQSQFKAIGLTAPAALKGYQQYYPLYQDSMLSTTLQYKNTKATYGVDFITPLTDNENGSFKSNKIIFAGYGIDDANYNDYANLNVKGKVVVFFLGEPKKEGKYFINPSGRYSTWTYPGIAKKLATAAAKGAVGALIINPAQLTFNQFSIDNNKKSKLYFPHESPGKKINCAFISADFAKKILGESYDGIAEKIKANETLSLPSTTIKAPIAFTSKKNRQIIHASNVLGVLEGTDKKDEYVFLTGHYDHLGTHNGKIYYGADDDGSGTVAVIAMATAFAKAKAAGHGPRRTIVFMTVSGEEKGLWGSEYYSDHPVFPLAKTTVDLNTDMIGRIDTERKTADTTNYVYVIGHDKLSSDLPIINEGANNAYTHLTLDYKFDDPKDPNRIYFRSDHYNFARKGVPILFFYDGMLLADYHKPTDTIEKISWELYKKRAQMIFYTAWDIANREQMLKRDIPLPATAQ
ncbi:MAG: M28 family peptidase [Bacteroidetes bacterium]|nr:M28 family peptidase [Bacteroidota bacterium]MBS1755807.1 M28 family peptidase [Bacteroidota bacterium]